MTAAATQLEDETVLCRRLSGPLRLYARRHCRDPGLAADLVHEVLVVVLEATRSGRLEGPDAAARFALATARNMTWDTNRRQSRRERVTAQKISPSIERAFEPPLPDALGLWHCLGLLNERVRRVLSLGFYDGYATREIASRLELSEANVRVIRHRGIVQLRRCLDGEEAAS